LTVAKSDLLESVQKHAIRIVYPDDDYHYQTLLIVASIDTLRERREELNDEVFQETGSLLG